ncbi:MAG: family 16 glycoside hydrolase [Verrucomicrobiota bacterium]
MKLATITLLIVLPAAQAAAKDPAPPKGFAKILFEDDFNREESDPSKEEPGNGWQTNSKSRAQGVKQVNLAEGAAHITMAKVADHGVSFTQDVAFRDAVIQMRFKIGEGKDLGINIADMKEKSVHAGHICMVRIKPDSLQISDLKTGNMKLEHREARQKNKNDPKLKKLLATKSETFKLDLETDEWHDLKIRIEGDEFTVEIDGKEVGSFSSEGIAHPTKSRIRVAVNSEAWIDDVKVWGKDKDR